MAIGKNAKKRAARRAFHDAPDHAAGKIPYAIHVIVHRDGKPEKIIFTSLTAFKAYRAEFRQRNPKGILTLVSDTDAVDDSKGKANRARVINKGIGQNWDRVTKPLPAPSKRLFLKDSYATGAGDAILTGWMKDCAKDMAIKAQELRDPTYSHKLWELRQKHRNI